MAIPMIARSQISAPKRLLTDLLEHTDRVFQNGLLSSKTIEEADSPNNMQLAAIHNASPSFSWQLENTNTPFLQTAFQIQVATDRNALERGEADMWDSQKVPSDKNIAITYNGKDLQPNQCYYWRVRIWDNNGTASPYSQIKAFRTASRLDNTLPRYPLVKQHEYASSITRLPDGYFIDFGKATFAQLELTLFSHKPSDTIIVHIGEAQDQGKVMRKPGGSIRYTHYPLVLSEGLHTYKINFNPDKRNTNPKANESGVRPILMPEYIGEVYPFRYCELEGYDGLLQANSIMRSTVSYPFDSGASWFSSSDTILNKVWDICKHTIQATTFCGVYVDGDRERIPYEADAYINQLSHYGTDFEFTMARYSVDYLMEWPTWPTEWIMQSILMLWNEYMYTGDSLLLGRHYPTLHARTLLALKDSTGLVSTRTGRQSNEFLKSINFKGKAIRDIVDWPQSGALGIEKTEAGEADGYDLGTYNTVVNAYHYRTLVLMEEIARRLGHEEDARQYHAQAEETKQCFNKHFLDTEKRCYRDGIESTHYSLHANMFPLAFGLVHDAYRQDVCDFVQSKGMACSVYGSQFLMDALFENDMDNHALSLLCSTGLRSWYNMIRLGSTMTLEAWDARFKPNLDWNHAWGAAPANIIPRYVVGLQPLEPGFRRMRIKPHPADLAFCSAIIPTIQGDVRITYDNKDDASFDLHVIVPPNTTAEVWMPRYGRRTTVSVNGKRVKAKATDRHLVVEIPSGAYNIVSETK